jgi:hypothetical protein
MRRGLRTRPRHARRRTRRRSADALPRRPTADLRRRVVGTTATSRPGAMLLADAFCDRCASTTCATPAGRWPSTVRASSRSRRVDGPRRRARPYRRHGPVRGRRRSADGTCHRGARPKRDAAALLRAVSRDSTLVAGSMAVLRGAAVALPAQLTPATRPQFGAASLPPRPSPVPARGQILGGEGCFRRACRCAAGPRVTRDQWRARA